MRICFYTETALPKLGGQELVIDALARQFLALGHEPLVLAPPPKRRRVAAHDAQLPYPVLRHPRFVSTRYFVEWYATFLRRAFRRHAFDVLHCHSIYPCAYLASLCRDEFGVPLVITSHGGDVHAAGRRLAKPGIPARYERSLAAADALISISKFTTAGYQRLCPTATTIEAIPNGVDLAPFAQTLARPEQLSSAIPAGEYILFLGRLNRRKGVDVLVDALAQLPPHLSTPLVIAGDGDERTALAAQCAQLGLAGRVHFVGAVSGAAKVWLLQNCRFTVIPSRTWEAFPLVVLESFAAGKPVVGTMIPGLADLVTPDQTGLLVPPESPTALAAALAELLSDESVTHGYGRNAAQIVQEFDWRHIARQHLDLYSRLRGGGVSESRSIKSVPQAMARQSTIMPSRSDAEFARR
ncbi:MAG TPA: glycosyltransferase family 4 protein [Pirellulales bacterium]|jgi:glycosyltransferase involved in cell wall biosynthesis